MSTEHISDLMTPAAIIDYDKLKANIDMMAKKARENHLNLRPHIKTHKCIEIGKMQIGRGARGITVSTLEEAEMFAKAGFDDITYAVPISRNKFEKALELSSNISLKILIDNPAIVKELDKASKEAHMEIDVMVKVDCGYHRCGVDPSSSDAVDLVKRIDDAPNLSFKGILTHAGHSYLAKNVDEIKRIAKQEQQVMVQFSKTLEREGVTPETVSIGSTPTVTLADSFSEEITEIRPGNYVFYDYTQVALGVCNPSDCALTVLASIIGVYPDRVVIDAGATALSKDMGPTHKNPNCGFGQVIMDYDNSILANGLIIDSLSQEHAKISMTRESKIHLNTSDMLRIIPNHSCLAANLFDKYTVVKSGHIIDNWKTRGI
jgi:D-serine deaminase-like pyridoxal phosphate-dependent protein